MLPFLLAAAISALPLTEVPTQTQLIEFHKPIEAPPGFKLVYATNKN
jgi:hypothetical protein